MAKTSELTIETWYIPSFYGDVRLEADRTEDPETEATVLIAQNLTPTEEAAMEILRRRAVSKPKRFGPFQVGKIPWATAEDFRPIAEKTYRETEVKVRLRAPIEEVASLLSRAMKPGRRVVSAVKFADGRIEEIRHAATTPTEATKKILALPVSTETALAKVDETALAKVDEKPEAALVKDKKEGQKIVSVAAPVIGCPSPDFGKSEVRARRVLMTFLDEQQQKDLLATGRFITKGRDTGRRYLLSLRDGPEGLLKTGRRGVYDLDGMTRALHHDPQGRGGCYYGGPLCVHDWTVPPSEEMLAIHLMLSLPGRERLMRSLPEILGQ